jgi:hypothetical protein
MPSWVATIVRLADEGRGAGRRALGCEPEEPRVTLAASASIAEAGLTRPTRPSPSPRFVALGSTTVAGAVLFYLVAPVTAARPLAAIKQFMSATTPLIMMVVLLLLGAKLLSVTGSPGIWD